MTNSLSILLSLSLTSFLIPFNPLTTESTFWKKNTFETSLLTTQWISAREVDQKWKFSLSFSHFLSLFLSLPFALFLPFPTPCFYFRFFNLLTNCWWARFFFIFTRFPSKLIFIKLSYLVRWDLSLSHSEELLCDPLSLSLSLWYNHSRVLT